MRCQLEKLPKNHCKHFNTTEYLPQVFLLFGIFTKLIPHVRKGFQYPLKCTPHKNVLEMLPGYKTLSNRSEEKTELA